MKTFLIIICAIAFGASAYHFAAKYDLKLKISLCD